MPVQFKDLQDKAKYKKLLKDELTGLKATPAVFHYFEKFKFDDGKLVSWNEATHTMPAKQGSGFSAGLGGAAPEGSVHY